MPPKNKTYYALLGMLSIHPGSGYELKYMIKHGMNFFWQESFGQIYPTLKKLAAQGLVTSENIPQEGKPAKQVYTITEDGLKELRSWLEDPQCSDMFRSETLLKIFLGDKVAPEVTIERLENQLIEAEEELRELEALVNDPANQCVDPYIKVYTGIAVDYGVRSRKETINWCKESISKLKKIEESNKNEK